MRVKKLHPDAQLPKYQSAGASGMDLVAVEDVVLWPSDARVICTGLALEIPPGFEGQIRPRSGLALKHGVTVLNAPGTIDSDYRGEVKVLLVNLSDRAHRISRGDRIAQLVIAPVTRVELVEVAELDETERGAGGFGSTG